MHTPTLVGFGLVKLRLLQLDQHRISLTHCIMLKNISGKFQRFDHKITKCLQIPHEPGHENITLAASSFLCCAGVLLITLTKKGE